LTDVSVGRVGRAHGRDGSFYVDGAEVDFAVGTRLRVAGDEHEVVRRSGTDERPLIKLSGIDDPAALRGEPLLADQELEEDEYLVSDLVGCEIEGLGRVEGVLDAPSCALLEVGEDRILVPLIADAVKHVDVERRIIEVDRDFLGY
jgi:16S rRNA processing protein RimM